MRISGSNDRYASNNLATVYVKIDRAAELRVSAVQSPVTGLTREPIAFSYLVSAGGLQTSAGVTVVVTVSGPTVNTATAAGGTCTIINTSQVTCALGDMAPGTTRRIDLSATATHASSFSAFAKATSTNMAEYTVPVGVRIDAVSAHDVAVRLDAPSMTVTLNEPFTASANIVSAGPQAVNDVVVSISLSPEFAIQSVIAPGGTCTSSAPVSCSFTSLAAGTSRRIDVNAIATAASANTIRFNARAQDDDEVRNDFGEITVHAKLAADVKVNPSASFLGRETQAFWVYTSLRSDGVGAAENVSMTFNLPEAFSIVSIASATASCSTSERSATCTVPSLAPGRDAVVQYEIRATRAGPVTLWQKLASSGPVR